MERQLINSHNTMNHKIQFYLIDKYEIYRKGINTILSVFQDMIQCHEVDSIDVLMNATGFRPDIILLGDITGKKQSRLILKYITQRFPSVRIIFTVDQIDEKLVLLLQEFSIHGCLLRSSTELEVTTVLFSVLNKNRCYVPAVKEAIKEIQLKADEIFKQTQFTMEEYTIIKLLCKGFNLEEIAEDMSLHPRKITGLLSKIKQKTGERTAQGLINYVLKNKIVSLSSLLIEEEISAEV
jgi:DNA-binding NarL/FixJ family response regulator